MDAWINEPLSSESSSDGEEFNTQIFSKCEGFGGDLQSYGAKKKSEELTEEELNKVCTKLMMILLSLSERVIIN